MFYFNWLLKISLIISVNAYSAEEKVIVKYKQNETIDLGDLEIKGNIIAPGDISISQRERRRFQRPLFDREDFKHEVRQDILSIR